MIEKVADLFEGLQIGKAEIGKQTVETPQGTAKLNAVKYDQDRIAVEGLDMDVLNSEPVVALAQFRIEASTGL